MSASVYNVGINRYHANFKQLSMCMYTQLFLREHFLPSNFCPTNSCILSCFFQLSRYLPFLYYTTMTTGHYNLLSICIITFFNVIIVFLNKITKQCQFSIFYQMKITHQFCIYLFGISLYTISQTGVSSHWKQMANENLKTMFLIMSICFQFGESLKLVNT